MDDGSDVRCGKRGRERPSRHGRVYIHGGRIARSGGTMVVWGLADPAVRRVAAKANARAALVMPV